MPRHDLTSDHLQESRDHLNSFKGPVSCVCHCSNEIEPVFGSSFELRIQNSIYFLTFWKHSIKCGLEYVFLKDMKLGPESLY